MLWTHFDEGMCLVCYYRSYFFSDGLDARIATWPSTALSMNVWGKSIVAFAESCYAGACQDGEQVDLPHLGRGARPLADCQNGGRAVWGMEMGIWRNLGKFWGMVVVG